MECLCVVAGVVLVVDGLEELVALPPQLATIRVAARAATSVSMAVSGVLLIGRAPVVIDVRGFGRPPYQAFHAATAAACATSARV